MQRAAPWLRPRAVTKRRRSGGLRMPGRDLRDLGEDATGFGAAEVRTLWHSILRPAAVLDAYMSVGPTGGDRYSRPIRLYLGLCGVLMLVLFLMGGMDRQLELTVPPGSLDSMLELAGKSRDAFLSDADGWMSLFLVPVLAACYAVTIAPLLRWWDPDDLGWRKAFRAAFAYLNAWTVLILPVCWMAYSPSTSLLSSFLVAGLGIASFIRMGRGRWWRSWPGAVGKSLLLAVVIQVAGVIGFIPVTLIGILGGLYGA